jgi:trehalose 6-phosphate phosphatase
MPGIPETLEELATRRDRIALAIVSGREVATLRKLFLVPNGIALSGIHGLELLGFDGHEEIAHGACESADELEMVRKWLDENVPAVEGFAIEDKRLALTLHYRDVPAAAASRVKGALSKFVHDHAFILTTRESKMAIEALPKGTSKARAVRALRQSTGEAFVPVYFGDDSTDEDAFREIADSGVTVIVGRPRRSAARYWVENPTEVGLVLKTIASALNGLAGKPTRG